MQEKLDLMEQVCTHLLINDEFRRSFHNSWTTPSLMKIISIEARLNAFLIHTPQGYTKARAELKFTIIF